MPYETNDEHFSAVDEEKGPTREIDRMMETLPAVQAEKDVWQNKFHEFDVYGHTLHYVDSLREIAPSENGQIDPNIIVAGWLHDIGKPAVAQPKMKDGVAQEREPGKPYHDFDDHEIKGAEMVREMDPEFFQRLGVLQEKVASLVYCHFLPMKGIKEMRKAATWEDFLRSYDELKTTLEQQEGVSKEEILTMFLADKLAQGDPGRYCTDREELFAIRDALLSQDAERERAILENIYRLQRTERN